MTPLTNMERIDLLTEAQEKLFEAIELLEDAVGDDANARAYMIDQLKTLASNDHGFLCNDLNMDKLIEQYQMDKGGNVDVTV